MKQCLYSKCGKKFEPNKPKQKFCCSVHRVYHNRELALLGAAKNSVKLTDYTATPKNKFTEQVQKNAGNLKSEMEKKFEENVNRILNKKIK